MTSYRWAKLPTDWIRYSFGLCSFDLPSPGVDLAALKLLITICARAALPASKDAFGAGTARISYSEFELTTGLSRSMVARGLSHLVSLERIKVVLHGKGNIYSICEFDEYRGWGKLPYQYLLRDEHGKGSRLAELAHRGRGSRDALKIYLALIAFRDNLSGYSRLSYDKITEYTGINRSNIRGALSILYEAAVVHRERISDLPDSLTNPNQYWIAGVSQRRAPLLASVADLQSNIMEAL